MERIPFVAMNNGNVRIIVPARGYSLTHFGIILKIWVELLESYANTWKIAEPGCNSTRRFRTIIGYNRAEIKDFTQANSDSIYHAVASFRSKSRATVIVISRRRERGGGEGKR